MLKGVEGVGFVYFTDADVVRHNLVQRIVRAYDRYNENMGTGRQLALHLERNAAPIVESRPAQNDPPQD